MKHLSDDALWKIVRQPLAFDVDTRLRRLTEQSKARDLSESEQSELYALLKAYNEYVFKRSGAMAALQKRGYDVIAMLKAQEGEG